MRKIDLIRKKKGRLILISLILGSFSIFSSFLIYFNINNVDNSFAYNEDLWTAGIFNLDTHEFDNSEDQQKVLFSYPEDNIGVYRMREAPGDGTYVEMVGFWNNITLKTSDKLNITFNFRITHTAPIIPYMYIVIIYPNGSYYNPPLIHYTTSNYKWQEVNYETPILENDIEYKIFLCYVDGAEHNWQTNLEYKNIEITPYTLNSSEFLYDKNLWINDIMYRDLPDHPSVYTEDQQKVLFSYPEENIGVYKASEAPGGGTFNEMAGFWNNIMLKKSHKLNITFQFRITTEPITTPSIYIAIINPYGNFYTNPTQFQYTTSNYKWQKMNYETPILEKDIEYKIFLCYKDEYSDNKQENLECKEINIVQI